MPISKLKIKCIISFMLSLFLITTFLVACTDTDDSDMREIGISSDNIKDQYYEDIKSILGQQGFTNIITRPEERGLIFWKKTNTVKRITVNGQDTFTETSKFHKDALIVIIYYTDGEQNNGNN
ncbi:MAG: hypothetical protein J6B48_09115 [Clostridia bacterium]|nr:hypothetical protein [Clostridia bacterium]